MIKPNQSTSKDQGRCREDVSRLHIVLQKMALRTKVTFNDDDVFEDKERDTCRANDGAT
jgi:hypothetical protein